MERISFDELYLRVAKLISSRSTCKRRRVGCVLVDAENRVLATGYNGVARGRSHCIVSPCVGANLPSGTGLNSCEAIHAEENAKSQAAVMGNFHLIHTAYVTASPCINCVKSYLNTPLKRFIFIEDYPHCDAKKLWLKDPDREWIKVPLDYEKFEQLY